MTAVHASSCKALTECYQTILEKVRQHDEVLCVEEAASGTVTYGILLKLLKSYCSENLKLNIHSKTFEGRNLYEVVISGNNDDNKPTIMIEAGQDGGVKTVELAMYVVQQLVACEENRKLIDRAKWVVLPSANPDGMELSRQYRVQWQKNGRLSEQKHARGVDVTRNFDLKWASCGTGGSPYAPTYPGAAAFSEQESLFIKTMLEKHKPNLKAYVSLRRDGHSILYPFAHGDKDCPRKEEMVEVAGKIATKVNQRAGLIQRFLNDTIYNQNGKPRCGHSVDYALSSVDVPMAFELRVYLDGGILSKFHRLPKGFENSLRVGYFAGIKQLYLEVTKDYKPEGESDGL